MRGGHYLVLLLVIGAIVLVPILTGLYFARVVVKPKTFSRAHSYEAVLDREEFDKAEYEKLSREEVFVTSPFGYRLSGYFFPNGSSKKVVVLCHGITWTLFGSIKYMLLFRRLGFAGLVYDHRNHGESGGSSTTFGRFEKHDLGACVKWLRDRLGPDVVIGLHGESLGAAVILQYLKMDPGIDFCVADCSFSDLKDLLKLRLNKDYKLPSFPLVHIADLFVFASTGMHFRDASPVDALKEVTTPVLLVHGKGDDYIPSGMSIAMYKQHPESRKLFLSPEAGHAESYLKNPLEYERVVIDFLKSVDLL